MNFGTKNIPVGTPMMSKTIQHSSKHSSCSPELLSPLQTSPWHVRQPTKKCFTSAPPSVTVIKNGKIDSQKTPQPTDSSAVYTTLRTVRTKALLLLDLHMARLASGYNKLHRTSLTPSSVRKLVLPSVRLGMSKFLEGYSESSLQEFPEDPELKVTIVLQRAPDSSEKTPTVLVYIKNLTADHLPPIKVLAIKHRPRRSANVKGTSWAGERKPLEDQTPPDFNEAVLVHDGHFYEGLQTNFYAVIDGVIHTAPTDVVLPGTIQAVLVDVCEKNRIPVRYQLPKAATLNEWDGAFITSTSRGVLPLDLLRYPESIESPEPPSTCEKMLDRHFETNALIQHLRELVDAELEVRAEVVL